MSEQDFTAHIEKYAIGIDLGTTHCVVSYTPLGIDSDLIETEILPIPQLTSPGQLEEKSQLPSFLYLPHEAELSEEDLELPWSSEMAYVVGTLARNLGGKTPLRLVSSAKSWLSHTGLNVHNTFLPLNAPEGVEPLSPYVATCEFLEHLKAAWEYKFPDYPIEDQEITVTVPASFDPAARELTAEAAKDSGFDQLTLLEEPQAAVYNWIHANEEDWRNHVTVGDIILVVDVGGGTTDLSLIAVTEEDGNLVLNRIAVGDHILLGGDNMDLALAYRINAKLSDSGTRLQPWQIQAIVQACRDAKEKLLSDEQLDSVPIVVPNRGSKLIGGTISSELTAEEVNETLVEGFIPLVTVEDHPVVSSRGALTQIGLPYAQDPAISRHLAYFLSKQASAADELLVANQSNFIKPTAILFNGGVLKSNRIKDRIVTLLNQWLVAEGAPPVKELEGIDLDHAVAKGASYYGYVRQGKGVRIRGGIASTFYVGVESAMPAIPGMPPQFEALCVAPFGMEEGSQLSVPGQEFGLIVGEPVHFRFLGSTTRREDQPGDRLDYWEPDELEEFSEIRVTLPVGDKKQGEIVPVKLVTKVSELGTMCLEAIPRGSQEGWRVEFDIRD